VSNLRPCGLWCSGLVSVAVAKRPPLEHRRGIEPRSTGLQPVRSPLACGAWHSGADSNHQLPLWKPLASPSATGAWCARQESNLQVDTGLEPAASANSATRACFWWPRRESNSHARRRWFLRPVCLPNSTTRPNWKLSKFENGTPGFRRDKYGFLPQRQAVCE
jgi:hypothetical protein